MKKTCLGIAIALMMAGCGGGSSTPTTVTEADITPSIADLATDVATTGFVYLVTWPSGNPVDADTVSEASFFMIDGTAASAQVVDKGAYNAEICIAANAMNGEWETAVDGSTSYTSFTPESLSEGTTYYVCLTSAIAFDNGASFAGMTNSFTTASATAITVSSVSHTTITTPTSGEGTSTITVTFDNAPTEAPTLTVAEASASVAAQSIGAGKEAAAGTCTVDASDATIYTCPVTGLAGCGTFTDYTATISVTGMAEDYSFTFNSADDEFDNGTAESREVCYADFTVDEGVTLTVTGGTLLANIVGDSTYDISRTLASIASGGDFAFAGMIATNSPADAVEFSGPGIKVVANQDDEEDEAELGVDAGNFAGEDLWNFWADIRALDNPTRLVGAGTLANLGSQIAPISFCFVRRSNIVRTYVSDGTTPYQQLTADNLGYSEHGAFEREDMVAWDASDCLGDTCYLTITAGNEEGLTASNAWEYLRYRTSGFSGDPSADDCPEL